MKNIMKIIIALFTSVSLIGSASAGELTVTGTAKATYVMQSGMVNAAPGIGITNEIDFGAKGELDNGWTWNYQVQMDPAAAAANATNTTDDSRLEVTTGYGTLGIYVSEGGLDTDNAGSQSVYARPSDMSVSTGMADAYDIGGFNNIQLHTPAGLLPNDTIIKFALAPGKNTIINPGNAVNAKTADGRYGEKAMQLQVKTTIIDGVKIGADYFMEDGAGDATSPVIQKKESGSIFATYATGPASFGISHSLKAPLILGTSATQSVISNASAAGGNADSVRHWSTYKASAAFNVNDALSVSYEREHSNRNFIDGSVENATIESDAIQAAYTMGGMTLALSHGQTKNISYKKGAVRETLFAMTMAF